MLALAWLAPASCAQAQTRSRITTPSALSYPFGEPTTEITVSGTTDIPGEVELRCYDGTGVKSFRHLVKKPVEVSEGRFSVEVPVTELGRSPCQLRAVPVDYAQAGLPPGEETQFQGPLIVPSHFQAEPEFYFAVADTLAASFGFESAGTFALESELYSPSAHEDMDLFFGEANLGAKPLGDESTSSGVQVDGVNAYLPWGARELETELKEEAKKDEEPFSALSDKPGLTVSESFDEATHTITVHEEDPVVRCTPESVYPPKLHTCTGFVSTGVTLVRTWQTTSEDRVALMSDSWRSTDGLAHTVSARYYNEMAAASSSEPASYEFPGEATFAETHAGESKTLPGGGMILYDSSISEPEAGDGVDPQGAIVYDTPPGEPLRIITGSAEPGEVGQNAFELAYQRAVPAGGSSPTLRMAFVQGFGAQEVMPLAEAVLASYYPSVSISSPAEGTTVSTPSVSVSGTAADAVGLSSVTVNGQALGASGAWSTTVPLQEGANTITATATNQAGLSQSASLTVTYVPPNPPPPQPAHALAHAVGLVSGANGRATFTISCAGASGTSCAVRATLSTLEHRRKGRAVAVSARTKLKTLVIGSASVTIAAGHRATVRVKLDKTGRELLARFGKLPVQLRVTSSSGSVKTAVIIQNLTVRPAKKKRRR